MEEKVDNMTGRDLRNEMIDLVDHGWNSKSAYEFTYNDETVFVARPAPTPNQPGNGVVTFSDGSAPRWEDLRSSLQRLGTNGNSSNYNDFLKNPVSSNDFKSDKFKASVLSSFEVARRAEDDYLSRNQTKNAIGVALANRSAPTDTNANDLVNMFTAKGNDFDQTKQMRQDAYNQIMRRQRDSASTAGTSGSVAQKRATSRGKKQDASVGGMDAITAEMGGLRVSERATSRPVKQPGRSAKKTGSSRK